MVPKITSVDDYLNQAPEFAIPVLLHIRKLVHKACPDVVEAMKWGFPFFVANGTVLCYMAAFKGHCAFGFWKGSRLSDPEKVMQKEEKTGAGSFGRILSKKNLPSDKILISYLKEAVLLTAEKKKKSVAVKKKAVGKELPVPPVLSAALKKNVSAAATFREFPPSQRKEYIEWITEAKTDATRDKRLVTTIEQLAEGKVRHWKYKS